MPRPAVPWLAACLLAASCAAESAADSPAAPERSVAVPTSLVAMPASVESPVVGFGDAIGLGSPESVVAIASTPTGDGYWLATPDGGVFTYGDAGFHGSAAALALDQPVVAIAATPSGAGYWLAAADGGVFTFGDAPFLGAAVGRRIVGIATTPTGHGYWLATTDGDVIAFGDAGAHGAMVGTRVVGIAPTPSGRGYWLVAADGGVFTFGDAPFLGSAGAMRLDHPVVGIAPTRSGAGYWLATADGGVFTFGDAGFHGSAVGALAPAHEVVAIAARPRGAGYWVASAVASVTIAAAGDVHGETRVASLLASGGNPFAGIASVLAAADVAMVNLETTVGTLGEPLPKTYVFQAPVSLLRAVRDAGVDVVSLANNHAMDYGADALLETIANARAVGLVTVGAGRNADEAYAPALIELGGRRVAVVGLSRVNSSGFAGPDRPGVASALDVDRATAAVRAAAALADHVVVMIHWGIERDPCPDGGVRALAGQLVAAGADVIAGHHPHVLQGIEETGRSIVAYSLANFVWYHSRVPSDRTGVLTATLDRDGVRSHGFVPALVDHTGSPQPLAGPAVDEAQRDLATLVPGAGLCPG